MFITRLAVLSRSRQVGWEVDPAPPRRQSLPRSASVGPAKDERGLQKGAGGAQILHQALTNPRR